MSSSRLDILYKLYLLFTSKKDDKNNEVEIAAGITALADSHQLKASDFKGELNDPHFLAKLLNKYPSSEIKLVNSYPSEKVKILVDDLISDASKPEEKEYNVLIKAVKHHPVLAKYLIAHCTPHQLKQEFKFTVEPNYHLKDNNLLEFAVAAWADSCITSLGTEQNRHYLDLLNGILRKLSQSFPLQVEDFKTQALRILEVKVKRSGKGYAGILEHLRQSVQGTTTDHYSKIEPYNPKDQPKTKTQAAAGAERKAKLPRFPFASASPPPVAESGTEPVTIHGVKRHPKT